MRYETHLRVSNVIMADETFLAIVINDLHPPQGTKLLQRPLPRNPDADSDGPLRHNFAVRGQGGMGPEVPFPAMMKTTAPR